MDMFGMRGPRSRGFFSRNAPGAGMLDRTLHLAHVRNPVPDSLSDQSGRLFGTCPEALDTVQRFRLACRTGGQCSDDSMQAPHVHPAAPSPSHHRPTKPLNPGAMVGAPPGTHPVAASTHRAPRLRTSGGTRRGRPTALLPWPSAPSRRCRTAPPRRLAASRSL